ncbi:MAG: hypothetical protein DWQ31_19100 [Planctomycetota bacterium]|nr:MAG: hypothetical protein DWQ31_19100 [Planctomycetota bacterium]REJ91748.1 MAG: hypothetical protein DWQ35_13670 [Planctomycetota bacterium]REK26008.1 MAG: hypothetical protein DWQ42_10290 [Planctomycetota bacterium]REK46877.1 MAG: hypothetical protein DWQ46_05115 [Planctomycetota bacterium]
MSVDQWALRYDRLIEDKVDQINDYIESCRSIQIRLWLCRSVTPAALGAPVRRKRYRESDIGIAGLADVACVLAAIGASRFVLAAPMMVIPGGRRRLTRVK